MSDDHLERLRQKLASQWSRVRDLFQSTDGDGNGKISRSEWAVALPNLLGSEFSAAATTALFDLFDVDHSGGIDFHELHSQLRIGASVELKDQRLHEGAVDFERGVQQRVAVRRETGKSGSNVVSGLKLESTTLVPILEELRAAIASNLGRTMHLFKEWDTNGNGVVDRHEFAHALEYLGLESNAETATALFDAFDDDGNGALQFSELHSKLRQRVDVVQLKRQREARRNRKPKVSRELALHTNVAAAAARKQCVCDSAMRAQCMCNACARL